MTAEAPAPDRRSVLWPTIAMLAGVALLCGLGFWQLDRLAWKEKLLADIAGRATAKPLPLPPESAWAGMKADEYEFLHVEVSGFFEHAAEAYVFRNAAGAGQKTIEPGYQVLTPLHLADGSRIIVNRGFVPMEARDPGKRPFGQIAGTVKLTGLLRSPESRNLFTPADTPDQRLWFTRDPAAMAAWFHLDRVAPFSIDADASATPPTGLPKAGATVSDIPNNHLSYAVTWFGLAATLVGVYLAVLWPRFRRRTGAA